MRTVLVMTICVGLALAGESKTREALRSKRGERRQIAGCQYKGTTYQTGQTWQDGCLYNCICEDGSTGHYKCTDQCPTYTNIPPECQLVTKPGECCGAPQCNFQGTGGGISGSGTGMISSGGTMTGGGTITGGGTVSGSGTSSGTSGGTILYSGSATCHGDTIANCADYGKSMCGDTNYAQWVADHCCAYCGVGGGGGSMTQTGQTGSGGSMVIGTNGGCHDVRQNCADYTTAVCTNPSYNDWVQSNCAHFCNKCGSSTHSGGGGVSSGTMGGSQTIGGSVNGHTGTCSDKISNCATYAADVCTKHDLRAWATENCAGYCNLCGGSMTGTGGTGTESGGTMTGTGGTITGTGGTIIGGGTMTGTGGTVTGGGTMTGGGSVIIGGTCQDKIPNCASYAADVCTSASYKVWATENCASYCHFCGGSMTGTGGTGSGSGGGTMTGTGGTITGGGTMTGTGGTITGGGTMTTTGGTITVCADVATNCAQLDAADHICSNSATQIYAQLTCVHTCNMCTSSSATCYDKMPTCTDYGPSVCSDVKFTDWVLTNCPAFCHKCSSGTMTGTGGTGGTMTGTGGTMTGTGGTGGTMTGTGTITGTGTGTGGGGYVSTCGGACQDTINNCDTYAADVCTSSDFRQWAIEHCACHCHLCGTGGTMTGSGGTMTGTGGTGTGTGGTMTGTGGTGTGTGGTMTGTGGTGTGTGGTMTGTGGTGGTGSGTITGTGGSGIMESGTCYDKLSTCATYAEDVCTIYTQWAKENCAYHCHLCASGTMTGTGGTMTGTGGISGTGTITGTGTGTGGGLTGGNGTIVCIGTCMDKIPNCAAYAADVCTRPDFKAWATENCGCHCHLCSSGTGGTMTGTGGTMTGTGGTITGTGTGTGSGMTGQLSGCVYNGQAYTQGQTWTSGCKFSCQCVDASSGKYQCQELCVTWALPPQCTLNPPASGKCCSSPNCPAGFNIQYPPGYVEN